jgi:hypothetical protein
MAQVKLEGILQGTDTTRKYIIQFEEVSKDTGYDNDVLVQQFCKCLHRPILAALDKIHMPMLDTILNWQYEAFQEDANYRARTLEQVAWGRSMLYRTNNGPFTYAAALSAAPTNNMGVCMANTLAMMGKLTQDKRERWLRKGLCLRCRQKGHMAQECTAFFNRPIPTLGTRVSIVSLIAQMQLLSDDNKAQLAAAAGF